MSEDSRPRTRLVLALFCVGAVILILLALLATSNWIGRQTTTLIGYIASAGWQGQIAFLAALTVVCLTGIVPASILAIAAGTIYGFNIGVTLSAVGLLVGGVAGFAGARYLFREIASPWVNSRIALRKIDADIARQGWRVVALLRLSPIAPFGLTSYALGLTRLRFRDYLIGSVGSMPAMAAFVYGGALAHEALYSSSRNAIPLVKLGITGLGVAATFAASIHFYRVLNRRNID